MLSAYLPHQRGFMGLLVAVLEQGGLFAAELKAHTAIRRVAELTPDTISGDRLAELFARKLTLAKADEIRNPQSRVNNQHFAAELVEKLCATGMAIYHGMTQLKDKARQACRELKERRQILYGS